ncbi:MAG: substrate-binding domain-containing protein [Oscillospiraceae bacterium]|jgi:signal transduction histidine kinase/DNA-binding LacI/PurR family transcriptional regulator/CheY-like chemotaxis protein|nr:substrate-binding domain-containing protein [Oscillospiraceae bacterium]
MIGKKRLHFGVVFSTLDNTCQYDIWTGVVEFAKKNDIHLTAYCGTYQTTNYDIASHFDTVFDIIKNSDSLDGIIMFSGFIASLIGNEDFEKYAAEIARRLPLISVSYTIPGVASVLIDNITGTYSAVEHLIKVHGKKQIAYVRGPEGHPEAEDRLEGYRRALEANGLKYDERYVFPGIFSQESGQLAVRSLLEMPDISADAIVACDDSTAIGVLIELENQNMLVPADIAVAGFDDDRDSATFIPSISTVRQDFFEIGVISAKSLFDQINGKQIDTVTHTTPHFIKRQSCGCLEVEFSDIESSENRIDSFSSYINQKFSLLFEQHIPSPQINALVITLVDAILETPFSKNGFLRLFNDELISYSRYSKDILIWNEALSVLTTGVELFNDEVDCSYKILSTLIHATALVQEIRFKEVKIKEFFISDTMVMLRRIASNIVVIFDIDSLVDELHRSLPELSINTTIIGLYQSPIKSGDPNADRTIGTLLGFDDDKKFKVKSDIDNFISFSDYSTFGVLDFEGLRRDMFFIPLFFKDEEYGIILMPFDPDLSVNTYETLRVNISTAIKGANLIEELEHRNTLLAEASKAKSEFLSTMSHEMRTPMNAIIGMTAIGKKTSNIEDKNYSLNKIDEASSHLLGVINDVLDMAKIEANKLKLSPIEFQFDKMLQRVITVVNQRANEKKQTLTVSVDSKIPRAIICDDQRLTQVLTNLLSNAVKFTPESGSIHLEIFLTEKIDKYCGLRIEITDNGIGISSEQQMTIFQAFEQAESGTSRKYGGTGLGLVISKNIIELMGGKIWVESELGKGAKFIFTIKVSCGEEDTVSLIASDMGNDLSKSQSPSNAIDFVNERTDTDNNQDDSSRPDHNAFIGKYMLLAEDIDINREILVSLLEDTGIIIECAENGKEALEMVKAAPDKYDIIFMDVQMPQMSGYEATRHIRALPALQGVNLPIVAMTANVFKSDIEDCLKAGMNDHLGKPLDIEKVFEMLRKYIR